jgi:hypothetical protein
MFRVIIVGNKSFIDNVANSYENRDTVAMLCGDGELSLTYHTFDPLPADCSEYDTLVMSVEDALSPAGQEFLSGRTDKSPTMGHFLLEILICGKMDVSQYVNVEAFDDHGDILNYIMENLL